MCPRTNNEEGRIVEAKVGPSVFALDVPRRSLERSELVCFSTVVSFALVWLKTMPVV
jgi:hypothetical protein